MEPIYSAGESGNGTYSNSAGEGGNGTFSFSWRERKWKHIFFKMAAKLRGKRTSITTMRAKVRACATFSNPHHSHWSLPLSNYPLVSDHTLPL
jgi:hypothetical protein